MKTATKPKSVQDLKESSLMTDAELCELLRISAVTLRTHLREGPPRKMSRNTTGDVRLIRHFVIGGRRRWLKSAVNAFISGN